MLGRDDDYVSGLERAHDLHLAAGDVPRAVRCAFWIGHNMLFRGRVAPGEAGSRARTGSSRGRSVTARSAVSSSSRCGWGRCAGGDYEAGYATAAEAAAIGERFGDADLVWLARDDQGGRCVRQGRVEEGLRLVDEAMLAATAGELSPIVTGIVYCNTIAFCRDVIRVAPRPGVD